MSRSRFRAILFDLDGLMVDTEPYHFRAFQALLRKRGVFLPESVMDRLLGYDELTNLRDLKEMYHLCEDVQALLEERRKIYLEIISHQPIRPMEGFWEVSEEARRLGLKQAVVSSSLGEQVRVVLERLFASTPGAGERASFFDAVICGEEVEQTKPAPDLYLLAARRMGLAPKHCLALEDSPAGVQAAAAAGMPCLGVVTRYARVEDFSAALAVLGSLREVLPYLRDEGGN